MAAKDIGRSSDVPFDDSKLFWPNSKDTMHMHVADLAPLVFTEVGLLRQLAVLGPHFDDTAVLGQLGAVVALLGDISFGPQPESTMHLCIVNILSGIHKGKCTKVALRTSAA